MPLGTVFHGKWCPRLVCREMRNSWFSPSVSFLSWLPAQAVILIYSFTLSPQSFIHSADYLLSGCSADSAVDPEVNDSTIRALLRRVQTAKLPQAPSSATSQRERGARETTQQITSQPDLGH